MTITITIGCPASGGDHTHEDHWLDIEGAARLGRQAAGSERSHRKWLERQEWKKSGGGLNG